MHPFRNRPDEVDLIACESCGQPVWDHYVTDNGIETGSGADAKACPQFWLNGVSESAPVVIELEVVN
jgi:hypothetical protein